MPGYIDKLRARYQHEMTSHPQHSPYKASPKVYGTAAQNTIPDDVTAKLDEKRVKAIQQVVGGVLYYARAVDSTVLPALSSIASEQASATKTTEKKAAQLLDYLATHSKAVVRYYASDMILNIHSDASYLSESRARSRIAGEFLWAAYR